MNVVFVINLLHQFGHIPKSNVRCASGILPTIADEISRWVSVNLEVCVVDLISSSSLVFVHGLTLRMNRLLIFFIAARTTGVNVV